MYMLRVAKRRIMLAQKLLLFCLLAGGLHRGLAQEKNASALIIESNFIGPVTMAQFPPSVFLSDAPIANRYVLMVAIGRWNVDVACQASRTSLNFWGEEERLSDEVCQAENTLGELFGYAFLRTVEREAPEPTRLYSELMRRNGYDPEDRSTDKSTAIGLGNAIGMRVAEWFADDGWNSMGDKRGGDFGRPFEDYTGYTPANSPWELKHPLRWQPLGSRDMRLGRYTYQEYVIPFLGGYTKPFLMTEEEAASRQIDPPYLNMNATELSGNDGAVMDMLMREVFDASKNLTPLQRFSAHWWDNKFVSTGLFSLVYERILGLEPHFKARWLLGESLANYDALFLAWKEKRRVNAVRPQTIAKEFYKDEPFDLFVSEEKGVQSVLGKDWEPLVATQPHPEYPSGTAALCTAFADHAALLLKERTDAMGLDEEPPFALPIGEQFKPLAPFTVPEGVDVVEFSSVKEAGRSCSMSRLWAGVHFTPSIAAGQEIVKGVGDRAYFLVKDLSEGRVPENCWWCTQNI